MKEGAATVLLFSAYIMHMQQQYHLASQMLERALDYEPPREIASEIHNNLGVALELLVSR